MQKLYYSISEVSTIVDEEQHILRYWEKEFPQLKPKKNRGGNRIFSEKDVFIIKLIKKLLRIDKLSLKGAKENLERILAQNEGETAATLQLAVSEPNPTISTVPSEGTASEFIHIRKKDFEEMLLSFRYFAGFLEKY